jgi:hypothetical protein
MHHSSKSLSLLCALAVAVACSTLIPKERTGFSLTPERQKARDRMIAKLKTKQKLPFDKPQQAMAFFWAKRSPDSQPMGVSELEQAAEAVADMPVVERASASPATGVPLAGDSSAASVSGTLQAWQPLGPGNIGGRSRTLLIHDKKPHLMWTAGVAGGIW